MLGPIGPKASRERVKEQIRPLMNFSYILYGFGPLFRPLEAAVLKNGLERGKGGGGG